MFIQLENGTMVNLGSEAERLVDITCDEIGGPRTTEIRYGSQVVTKIDDENVDPIQYQVNLRVVEPVTKEVRTCMKYLKRNGRRLISYGE